MLRTQQQTKLFIEYFKTPYRIYILYAVHVKNNSIFIFVKLLTINIADIRDGHIFLYKQIYILHTYTYTYYMYLKK